MAIVRECATAQHIINDTNRGFSAAVNQAVRIANGEFVVLLNPDAYLEPHYISSLVAALNGFGMATGKLLQAETGLVDSKGIRMTRSGRHFDIDQGKPDSRHPTPDTPIDVFGVSGAAAMYKRPFITDATIGQQVLAYAHSPANRTTTADEADIAWDLRHGIYSG